MGRKKRTAAKKGEEFTYHKKSGYGEFVIAIIFASGVEIFLLHYFLYSWNYTISVILVIVSIYSMFFLISDVAASIKRPLVIYDNNLYIRIGLRWRVMVPLCLIKDVNKVNFNYVKSKQTLRAALLKQVNVEVILNDYVIVKGMYGLSKKVNKIYLYLDKPADFISSLTSR